MKASVEFFDTDFLGNKIEVGDKVILETPKYRDFAIGTVVSKAPKSCQVEYISFCTKSNVTVRQYYEQLIKYPIKEGAWIDIPDYGGNGWQMSGKSICPKYCSVCGDVYSKQYNYCPTCGAKMRKED